MAARVAARVGFTQAVETGRDKPSGAVYAFETGRDKPSGAVYAFETGRDKPVPYGRLGDILPR